MFSTTEVFTSENHATASIEEMSNIETVFRDAYDHTLSHFPDAKRRETLTKFVSGITMQYSMYMAFTSDGLQQLMLSVFSNEVVRDFVFRLTAAFQARLGVTRQIYSNLAEILTQSMCMLPIPSAEAEAGNHNDRGTVAIPEDIVSRLPTYEDVRLLLNTNKWMVTIVMISLYVRIEVEAPKAGSKG